jgi:dephospho-CoA kinase
MRLIVLTGGIACGKTTVGNYLRDRWGCTIIDSDAITRQIQVPGTPTFREIIKTFGSDFMNSDGTLNRRKLGDLVFHDPEARSKLNAIVHPAVMNALFFAVIYRWIRRDPIVILDIPLFFEVHFSRRYFHEIVTVAVDPAEQVKRLMRRNNLTLEAARARVDAQMPTEDKCRQSTVVIRNDGTEQNLEATLDELVIRWKDKSWFTYLPDPLLLLGLVASIIVIIIAITFIR